MIREGLSMEVTVEHRTEKVKRQALPGERRFRKVTLKKGDLKSKEIGVKSWWRLPILN